MEELESGADMHSNNQRELKLPGWEEIGTGTDLAKKGRLIAKTFLFRILYGGGAYSFSVDPDFSLVGYKEKEWQEVIDKFYTKYKGLAEWHKKILMEVVETGQLVVPCTGRIYKYEAFGGKYPDTQIKNFIVQGLGADIVALARVSLFNRLKKLRKEDSRWDRCLMVNTVHDSYIFDYDDKLIDTTELVTLIEGVFKDLPANFYKMFKTEFNLSVNVEQEIGKCWGEMTPFVVK